MSYARDPDTDIKFYNTLAANPDVFEQPEGTGFSIVATSLPNFGAIDDPNQTLVMECQGGLFRLISLRLSPVFDLFEAPPLGPFFVLITGHGVNDDIIAAKVVRLDISRMEKAKTIKLSKGFKNVRSVSFEELSTSSRIFGFDDVQVRVRAGGCARDDESSTTVASKSVSSLWSSAIHERLP